MDNTELEIEDFKEYLKEQERHLEIAEALETLRATRAYQLVFEEVFIKEQSENLLKKLIDPSISLTEVEDKDSIIRKLDMIRLFNVYLGAGGFIESNGSFAKEFISNKDSILEEMREVER